MEKSRARGRERERESMKTSQAMGNFRIVLADSFSLRLDQDVSMHTGIQKPRHPVSRLASGPSVVISS